MKIGVLSDTHMPERAKSLPAKLCAELKKCDMVIHVGDMVTMEVCGQLQKLCPNFKAVCGNMDPAPIRKQFPEREILQVGKFRIGIQHGFGPPDKLIGLMKEAFKKDKVDMIIFGHSHNPHNEQEEGIIFFNPGSPTDEIFAPYKSFGIIEINDKIEARIIKL
jgi:putative phosphoesterase